MPNKNSYTVEEKFEALKCCVIIPTYNNAKTLSRVLDGVLKFTTNVLVVNDGSTDATNSILKEYTQISQIHFQKNRGKGIALRQGFKNAIAQGFEYAITIDSDGQHFPADIPVFVSELWKDAPNQPLLIGSRNMTQEGVPKKSSFGNKFSNFWFWFETGIWLEDTQSGFRAYPLQNLKTLSFFSTKFEFEIEVIVKTAWQDVEVKNVPINVLYDESERVSHFRPVKDFTRISILNTWLVVLTLLYVKPRAIFKKLRKKGFKKFLFEDLLGSTDSPKKIAFSIALGIFIGLSPLWGLHTVIVLFLAMALRLNKVVAFTFSNVSLAPFIPLVVFASVKLGALVLQQDFSLSLEDVHHNLDILKNIKIYLVGSFVLASSSALLFGFLGFVMLKFFNRRKLATP